MLLYAVAPLTRTDFGCAHNRMRLITWQANVTSVRWFTNTRLSTCCARDERRASAELGRCSCAQMLVAELLRACCSSGWNHRCTPHPSRRVSLADKRSPIGRESHCQAERPFLSGWQTLELIVIDDPGSLLNY